MTERQKTQFASDDVLERMRELEAENDSIKLDKFKLLTAVRNTLNDNRHLADGDNCTLLELKRCLQSFESWD